VRAIDLDRTVDEIGESDRPGRNFDADGTRPLVALARIDLVTRQRVAGPIVVPGASRLLCRFTLGLDLFRRAVTVVRVAAGDQPVGHRAMTIETF
jgi:hypothetical protein